jgi:hypothetical protein
MTKETFLELIKVGCDWGSKPVRLRPIIGEYWAMSIPGVLTGGRGFSRECIPTRHVVVDLSGEPRIRTDGYNLYHDRQVKHLKEVEGRLKKSDILQWKCDLLNWKGVNHFEAETS